MPRLPFLYLRSFRTFAISIPAVLVGLCAAQANAAPPTAVITTAGAISGPAPFAVHVHGLDSTVGAGNELTARYQWDFGDPSGQYNKFAGWNAAHIYNQPGTYTLKLKLTNHAGQVNAKTITVTINPANRTAIYVSPSGSDSNSGLSPDQAVKTVAKAATLLGNNKAILFERGGSWNVSSTVNISQNNVLIGSYGSGSLPLLNWTTPGNYPGILHLTGDADDIVIQNMAFDSDFAPNNLIVRAIHPHGRNVTVRNCHFAKVSYAMNTGAGAVQRFLTLDNTAGELGAYYVWGEGNDHTHLGNTVAGSVDEHVLRLVADRVNISYNHFTNDAKSNIWAMLGDHCYIANNTLIDGRVIIGPNHALGSPSERFQWVVFENNEMFNHGVVVYSGAEHLMARNNVINYDGGNCFDIWGYLPAMDRTTKFIQLLNNTAFNDSNQWGRFVKIGDGAETLTVRNNLYCAPALNANNGSQNVRSDDNSLAGHTFQNNLWSTPNTGNYPHTINGGGQTVTQWANYPQT
ncbi:MAG: PKD domain-containing protein, partial [Phycisphaerales bacterium]|nr:PKD domain-containing protein [Phycisphaerales bacterium]